MRSGRPSRIACYLLISIACLRLGDAAAQGRPDAAPPQAAAPPQVPAGPTYTVNVVETAPLPGVELPLERIPAPVQTATAADIERSGALDLSGFLNQRLTGITINEIQGNPFQADVNYRGYTASPLLGTPQGLSVYMDGVRLNQPFGEVMSWDLIPALAISSTTLMPGSNPLFGLNTLGGALSIQTKSGLTTRGATVEAVYGSDARRAVDFEYGGANRKGLHWYLAGNLFAEDGWREDSPSDVRQIFGKLGWHRDADDVSLTLAHADNELNGNGLQEQGFLDRDYSSVYTKPDTTNNRATFINVTTRRSIGERSAVSGNAYYREHQHEYAQRRHQRRLARSGDLSTDRRGAGRPCRRRVYGIPHQRRQRQQHALSLLALHRQRAAAGRTGGEMQRPHQSHAHVTGQRWRRRRSSRCGRPSGAATTSSPPAPRTTGAASASTSRLSSDI